MSPTDISPQNLPYYAISTTTTIKPPSTSPTNQSVLLRTSTPAPNIPAPPHQHASSAPSTNSLNTTPSIIHHHQYIHTLPPTNHHPHPRTPSTSEHPSSTQTARMGLTTCGTSAFLSSYNTLIITRPTSETHGADTSNTATVRTFSAYKPILFKPSPTHIHSPLTPPPSGGYSSTSTC